MYTFDEPLSVLTGPTRGWLESLVARGEAWNTMEVDCGLVMTLRSVEETGDACGEKESPANGDGGAITGTTGSLDGPLAPGEGGGIFTVVGTALVAGGIFTTTAPAGRLYAAAAACGFVLAVALLGCDAGMLTTVAVGFGSGSSLLEEDRLMYSC